MKDGSRSHVDYNMELTWNKNRKIVALFLIIVTIIGFIASGSLWYDLSVELFDSRATIGNHVSVPAYIPNMSIPRTNTLIEEASDGPYVPPAIVQKIIIVKSKDNLGEIFKKLGLSLKDSTRILALSKAKVLKRLVVGRKMVISVDQKDNSFKSLSYEIDRLTKLTVRYDDKGIIYVDTKRIKPTVMVKYASSKIETSVYASAKKVGLPKELINQLTELFNSKLKVKKISNQDRLSMFYKEYLVDGKSVRNAEIIAAELKHDGAAYRLIAFDEGSGIIRFYTPDGRGIKPFFARYPVIFSRISSKFSHSRKHPILGYFRPHLGVDLVAKYGAPVKATSNGKVVFAGNKSGYGRTVMIKNGKYTTLCAHLSKFTVSPGKFIKRGEVIGYVGSSGLATNPHVHYEFHINGVPQDPTKIALPENEFINAKYRGKFFAVSKSILAQLDAHQKANRNFAMHSYDARDSFGIRIE